MFSKSASAGTVYVFGNNIDGQLGISSIEDHLKTPTCMDPPVEASRIARVVATKTNSFALTVDGSVLSAGSNENNELGRPGKRSLLSRLDALEAFRITDCACGDGFVMLTLKDGRTIGWGANDLGQLGLGSGNRDRRDKPKLSTLLSAEGGIVQCAAGAQHVVCLTRQGAVYSWGGNRKGQLGDGFLNSCPYPKILPQLRHRPVISLSCGEAHTLALTVGGNVFVWGDNAQGQLGLGDTTPRLRPELVRSLRAARSSSISAGKAHSMSLAPSGLLFAWGSNFFGQLGIAQAAAVDVPKFLDTPTVVEKLRPGYNNNNNQSFNANVNVDVNVNLSGQRTGREGDAVEVEGEGEGEVEGMVPIQMSCGASHSLVLCEGKMKGNSSRAVRTVWVMGCGSSGQLGTGGSSTTYAPTLLDLDTHINAANTTNTTNPRASDSDSDSAAGGGDAEKDKTKTKTSRVRARADPIAVSTGGPLSMHSYVFTSGVNLARAPLPKLDLATLLALIRRLRDNPGKSNALTPLREAVSQGFGSIAVLNASFRNLRVQMATSSGSGLYIDLSEVRQAYSSLVETQCEPVLNTLGRALLQMTEKLKEVPTDDPENLQVFLIVLENPLLLEPSKNSMWVALERVCSGILALPRMSRTQLFGWLRAYPSEYFARIVRVVQGYLSFGLSASARAQNIDPSPAVLVLEILYRVNEEGKDGRIVPEKYFVNDLLASERPPVDLHKERFKFLLGADSDSRVFNYMKYPFLLDVTTKSEFLQCDYTELKTGSQANIASSLNSSTLSDRSPLDPRTGKATGISVRMDARTGRINQEASNVPYGIGVSLPGSYADSQTHLWRMRRGRDLDEAEDVRMGGDDDEESDMTWRDNDDDDTRNGSCLPVAVPPQALSLNVFVRREHLLDDLLHLISRVASSNNKGILFLPLSAAFEGEEGIDAGGVSKELLTLAVRQLVGTYGILGVMGNGSGLWFVNSEQRVKASREAKINQFKQLNQRKQEQEQKQEQKQKYKEEVEQEKQGSSKEGLEGSALAAVTRQIEQVYEYFMPPTVTTATSTTTTTTAATTTAITTSDSDGSSNKRAKHDSNDKREGESESTPTPTSTSTGFQPISEFPHKLSHQFYPSGLSACQNHATEGDTEEYDFEAEFSLGLLYGFASYHGCLVDLPLPACLYKALLAMAAKEQAASDSKSMSGSAGSGSSGSGNGNGNSSGSGYENSAEWAFQPDEELFTLADLYGCDEQLAKGLQALQDWDGDDGSVENVFGVSFVSSENPLLGAADGEGLVGGSVNPYVGTSQRMNSFSVVSEATSSTSSAAGISGIAGIHHTGASNTSNTSSVTPPAPVPHLYREVSLLGDASSSLGSEKDVTLANRALYVRLFVKRALLGCVSRAATAFLKGLQVFFFARTTFQIDQTSSTATGGPIFRSQRKNQSVSTFRHNLCSSTEMEILLCGTKDVGDLTLLRLTTSYRGEFTDEHRIVQWLWEVLADMNVRDQRRFLHFVTGSDRVPVGGLQTLKLVVQSTRPSFSCDTDTDGDGQRERGHGHEGEGQEQGQGQMREGEGGIGNLDGAVIHGPLPPAPPAESTGSDEIGARNGTSKRLPLPVSHTCFNILDLPAVYESKAQLKERLLLALEHLEGFGLV